MAEIPAEVTAWQVQPASTWMSWSIGRLCEPGFIGACSGCLSRHRSALPFPASSTIPTISARNLGLTFGRLRPVHVNGVIFGAFSTLFIGECYYLVPRLCGVRVPWPQWGVPLAWVWNIAVCAGAHRRCRSATTTVSKRASFRCSPKIPIFIVVAMVTAQFLITIGRRLEPPLYVALWYLIGAFVWTTMNLVLGSFILPYTISGINSAAFHGLYIHYIVGLVADAGGLRADLLFPAASARAIRSTATSSLSSASGPSRCSIPSSASITISTARSPTGPRRIAIITSMLLIIPVWTVLVNFFGTMMGSWDEFGRNLPAKFLIMGSLMYLVGCFQGSTEALRSIQQPTHFTDFVISHSHLTVFGTFVVWAMGGLVYVWPRVCGRELWSFRLGNWSFWLITVGISTMGLVLTAAGLQQGFQWMAGTEWLDTVVSMQPYWLVRTLSRHQHGHRHVAARHQSDDDGAGQARRRGRERPALRARPRPPSRRSQPDDRALRRAGRRHLLASSLALITQGVLPFFEPSARTSKVTAVVRTDFGQLKWMLTRRHRLHAAAAARPRCLSARGLLVLPFAVSCARSPARRAAGARSPRSGEFAYDVPHLFGTRRIGPDLTRVGLKYSDEWHFAHFWNPRMLLPDSIMAPYRGLFDTPRSSRSRSSMTGPAIARWKRRRSPKSCSTSRARSRSSSRRTPTGCCSCRRQRASKAPVIVIPNDEYKGDTVKIAAETERSRGAHRLSAEARHEPRQMARPVRAAAA